MQLTFHVYKFVKGNMFLVSSGQTVVYFEVVELKIAKGLSPRKTLCGIFKQFGKTRHCMVVEASY